MNIIKSKNLCEARIAKKIWIYYIFIKNILQNWKMEWKLDVETEIGNCNWKSIGNQLKIKIGNLGWKFKLEIEIGYWNKVEIDIGKYNWNLELGIEIKNWLDSALDIEIWNWK